MKSTLKYIGLLLCIAHFSMLTLFNMAHVSSGRTKALFMEGLNLIRHCTICSAYTTWTGLFGGYGFYSPSVGNTYQIQFCRYQEGSKKYYNSPGLISPTAQLRFQSYLDIASALLDGNESYQTNEKKQAKASIQAACKYLMKQIPCDSLEAELISKQIKGLSQWRSLKPQQTKYLALYRYVQVPEKYP